MSDLIFQTEGKTNLLPYICASPAKGEMRRVTQRVMEEGIYSLYSVLCTLSIKGSLIYSPLMVIKRQRNYAPIKKLTALEKICTLNQAWTRNIQHNIINNFFTGLLCANQREVTSYLKIYHSNIGCAKKGLPFS